MFCPTLWVGRGTEGSFHLSVKSFDHTVGGWVVSGGTEVSATDESRQCREKGGFELSATIGSDAGRDAETSNP